MATAKYTKGKDEYFQARVWDGTYTDKGAKHQITLRAKKSSRTLEEMVKDMEEKVKNRNVLKESSLSVPEYAATWLEIYKHDVELNTKAMYRCITTRRLFCTAGKDIMTKSSYVKLWANIQKKMDAPDLTAHIFRHNYCTNLCYQIPTISIKKITELLGDNEKMVIEVYNHIILEKEDAQKAVEMALNG